MDYVSDVASGDATAEPDTHITGGLDSSASVLWPRLVIFASFVPLIA